MKNKSFPSEPTETARTTVRLATLDELIENILPNHICAITHCLILDEDGLYDPGHYNDRLLLGLKGR